MLATPGAAGVDAERTAETRALDVVGARRAEVDAALGIATPVAFTQQVEERAIREVRGAGVRVEVTTRVRAEVGAAVRVLVALHPVAGASCHGKTDATAQTGVADARETLTAIVARNAALPGDPEPLGPVAPRDAEQHDEDQVSRVSSVTH